MCGLSPEIIRPHLGWFGAVTSIHFYPKINFLYYFSFLSVIFWETLNQKCAASGHLEFHILGASLRTVLVGPQGWALSSRPCLPSEGMWNQVLETSPSSKPLLS